MFGRIAPRYDLLNHLLSGGIDRTWRARLVARAGDLRGAQAVDVCAGTGDLAFALAAAGARVVAVDFTPQMLALAERKRRERSICFVRADALALPLANGSMDCATIAFGLRNLADRRAGLQELARVVRPGGAVLVLEFSQPRQPVLAPLYRFYLRRVLPRIGAVVSGDGAAYRYLQATVLAWPSPDALRGEMEEVGLVGCGYELLSAGIACLSFAVVPRA